MNPTGSEPTGRHDSSSGCLEESGTRILDLLDFDFPPRALFEASAGTGKTYTLSALYVRLVLGHCRRTLPWGGGLHPSRILVVTFTEAATQELRDRIRARLSEGAVLFRALADGELSLRDCKDPFYAALATEVNPEGVASVWRHQGQVLDLASQAMDEAAVFTIHGWCQRMLTQHAFDSTSLFEKELISDDQPLVREVAMDYWRIHCTHLAPELYQIAELPSYLKSPSGLIEALKNVLRREGAIFYRDVPIDVPMPASDLMAIRTNLENTLEAADARLKDVLTDGLAELKTFVEKVVNPLLDRKIRFSAYQSAFAEFCQTGHLQTHSSTLKKLCRRELESRLKPGEVIPANPLLQAIDEGLEALEEFNNTFNKACAGVLLHARQWCASQLDLRKMQSAVMGFDDLIKMMHAATRPIRQSTGLGDSPLACSIGRQYPVALIDEFQDTDRLQYEIFNAIYGHGDQRSWLMIGDPKQAIYSFRGADIRTYLQARALANHSRYTLGTNFRSTQRMVQALNHFFTLADYRAGEQGVFRLGKGPAGIPYEPVGVKGLQEDFHCGGEHVPALTMTLYSEVDLLNKPNNAPDNAPDPLKHPNAESVMQALADCCANRILDALKSNSPYCFKPGNRAPGPSDVAVLVRDFNEARVMREALQSRGLASVYLSGKDHVLQSAVAEDLYRILKAVLEPNDASRLKAALSSRLLGLSWQTIANLSADEVLWEDTLELVSKVRDCWRHRGVLPAIRQLLDDFKVPARLLEQKGGERLLTDCLHLAELLQTESVSLEGPRALLNRFAQMLTDTDNNQDELLIRLESDEKRIRIVTIHKSKGLEYSLVFLPFANRAKSGSNKKRVLTQVPSEHGVDHVLDGLNDQQIKHLAQWTLQEEMRLLYVALTRAKYACWLGLGLAKDWIASPLSQIVWANSQGQLAGWPSDPGHISSSFLAMQKGAESFSQYLIVGPQQLTQAQSTQLDGQASEAFKPWFYSLKKPVVTERWWIASYSALRHQSAPGLLASELAIDSAAAQHSFDLVADNEGIGFQALAEAAGFTEIGTQAGLTSSGGGPDVEPMDIHRFPKGPEAGTLLHGLLEWVVKQGVGRVLADLDRLRRQIRIRLSRKGWDVWCEPIEHWLVKLLQDDWDLGSVNPFLLSKAGSLKAEMEFWIGVSKLNIELLDRTITSSLFPGLARPRLEAGQLNGMLKGFMDLVFEHEGRYWVADYKSNWLGKTNQNYTHVAMTKAMLEKRYDVQFVLYLLALHRLLKARLPGYSEAPAEGFEKQTGGAICLFLRGTGEPESAGRLLVKPPASLILTLDEMFDGSNLDSGVTELGAVQSGGKA